MNQESYEGVLSVKELYDFALKGLRYERQEKDHLYRKGLRYLAKHSISSSSTEEEVADFQVKEKRVEEIYQEIQELDQKIVDLAWFVKTELEDKNGK